MNKEFEIGDKLKTINYVGKNIYNKEVDRYFREGSWINLGNQRREKI
jgi:hypothetical protein